MKQILLMTGMGTYAREALSLAVRRGLVAAARRFAVAVERDLPDPPLLPTARSQVAAHFAFATLHDRMRHVESALRASGVTAVEFDCPRESEVRLCVGTRQVVAAHRTNSLNIHITHVHAGGSQGHGWTPGPDADRRSIEAEAERLAVAVAEFLCAPTTEVSR